MRGPRRLGLTLVTLAGTALPPAWSQERPADPSQDRVSIEEDEVARATRLFEEASQAFSERRLADARRGYEEALALRLRVLGADHPDVARSFLTLAMIKNEEGDFAGAWELCGRARRIADSLAEPPIALVARLENMTAKLLHDQGDYLGARAQLDQALERHRERLSADPRMLIALVVNAATGRYRVGDLTGARDLYEEALRLREQHSTPKADVILNIENLSVALFELGDYAGSRKLRQQAVDEARRHLSPGHAMRHSALNNLAQYYLDMGEPAAAREFAEEAVHLVETTLGPEHYQLAMPLATLGAVLSALGETPRAAEVLSRAVAVGEKGLGPEHPELAVLLIELGRLHVKEGRCPIGLPVLERALAIRERTFGPDHAAVADALEALAEGRSRCGRAADAAAVAQRGLDIRTRQLGRAHPLVARSLAQVAALHYDEGALEPALDAALEAEGVARDHYRLTIRSLGERQALLYSEARPRGLDMALTLAARGAAPARLGDVFDAVVRSRALVRDELTRRQRAVAAAADADMAASAQQLTDARERLARLAVRGPEDRPDAYRRVLDEARSAKEAAELALAGKSAAFEAERLQERAGGADVVAALPPGTALVAYVRYVHHGPSPTTEYLAFVVRSGARDIAAVPLGPASVIDAGVTAWRSEILRESTSGGRSGSKQRRALQVSGTKVRRAIFDPVASHLRNVDAVFVVPDGMLALVPFAALPSGDSGYLLERGPTFRCLSVERDLLARPGPPGRGLLAIGDPNYEAHPRSAPRFSSSDSRPSLLSASSHQSAIVRGPASPCFAPARFKPLHAAGQELGDVAEGWGRGGEGVLLLRGAEASESMFKRLAPGRRVVHVATHGFFTEARCVAGPADPLLRSGLALAGANRRAEAPEGEDGILTGEEVAGMDLGAVEWVVLSACESGLGDFRVGEGLLGLQRAFRVAGARTVVMSLWAVDDASTRRFMRELYRQRFRLSRTTAVAVRQAALEVRRSRRARGESEHPFYWAGFVAAESGMEEPRRRPPLSTRLGRIGGN